MCLPSVPSSPSHRRCLQPLKEDASSARREAALAVLTSPVALQAGISVLGARVRTLIHRCRLRTATFLHPTLFRSNSRQLGPRSTGNRLEPLLSGHFSDTAPLVCPVSSPAGRASLHFRPRVSLPAPAAPRFSAACRRTAAGSDALPPAGASSTAHASPAGPRFSPAAAGDLSATSA